ncbi:MAG: 5' nucleotidase, NT5C type [Candidatus Saccharimonadaceae bacterium]
MTQQITKKRPVISVDIDDVLAHSAQAFVDFANTTRGSQLTVDDYEDNWLHVLGLDPIAGMPELGRFADAYHETIINHRSIEAYDALVRLKQKYDLIIVTARRSSTKGDTLAWVQREFPGIFLQDKIFFAGMFDIITENSHHMTKGQLLKDLGADYHIDDQPKHCIGALEQGIQPLLFGDYSWNRSVEVPEGMVRVHDWRGVLEYFNGIG